MTSDQAADHGDRSRDLHVALVEPEIPWNTGNVGRTALAVGAQLHLVHPLGFDIDDRAVRRAGLDYWPHVDVVQWPDWNAFEATICDYDTVCLFSAEAERPLWEVALEGRVMLVFGSETRGLPAAVRQKHLERLVTIPMQRTPVRSLNVSSAAAIALFEATRQRQAERA